MSLAPIAPRLPRLHAPGLSWGLSRLLHSPAFTRSLAAAPTNPRTAPAVAPLIPKLDLSGVRRWIPGCTGMRARLTFLFPPAFRHHEHYQKRAQQQPFVSACLTVLPLKRDTTGVSIVLSVLHPRRAESGRDCTPYIKRIRTFYRWLSLAGKAPRSSPGWVVDEGFVRVVS